MRILTPLLVGALLAAPLSHAVAQEITASGNLQTETSWLALKNLVDAANNQTKMAMALAEAIKTCGNKGMVYGPDHTAKDANGCVSTSQSSFEVGTFNDGAGYSSTPRSYTITFAKPFVKAPKVYTSANNFQFENKCNIDDWRLEIATSNVTSKSFTLTLNGKKAGCSKWVLRGVTWIAVAE